MNKRRSLAPLLGIATALISLFIIVTVLIGQGNHLAMLFRYLLIGGFVCGLLFPRGALLFWLVLCGYTDMLKRLMVVFGNVEHSDLFNVLGIPPVMICGVTFAVLVGASTHRFQLQATHWRLFFASCLLVLVSVAWAAKETGGSLAQIIPAVANDGTYAMLLFVVPALFKDSDDVLKIAKVLLWAYVPVALYGIFQQVHGFQDFEIAYLKTGLTLEIKQLYFDEVRAFSTMNSPTSFSVVCGLLCALSLMLHFIPRRDGGGPLLRRTPALLFASIFLLGILASTSRSAMFLVMIALVGFACFRSGGATRWFYASLVIGFATLVFLGTLILSHLDSWQHQISDATGDGTLVTQLSRVGTFSDRLRGFTNLVTNPDVYTLFGYGAGRGSDTSDPLYAHDMISNTLVTHGLATFVPVVLAGIVVLTWMHRRVLRLQNRHHRLLASGFIALAMSLFVLSCVSGSVLGTFPVNALMWLCFALLMLVYQSDHVHSSEIAEAVSEVEVTPHPAMPRVVHRFSRSGRSASESGM